MARAVLLLVFAALASLGAALDDDAMAACLRCVNEECEGNEAHSEICSDCLGEDCDECGDAVGESERESFVRGGCDFDDGSEVGSWFRDEGCGSLRGCDEDKRRYEPCDSNDDCEGECKFCYVDEDGEGHCELCYWVDGTCAYDFDGNEELEARQNCEAVCETGGAQTCTTSYYRSDDEVASKEVAREYCGADGLARIDAAEQNVNALSQCDMAMCWLDLQEVTHDGTWVWSDGSTPGYLPWNSQYDQPGDDYGPEADAVMNAGDVEVCVEINQCVGCTRQFFTKSFLGDDAAVLARSSGEESASPRHRAGVALMAWRLTRRISTNAP